MKAIMGKDADLACKILESHFWQTAHITLEAGFLAKGTFPAPPALEKRLDDVFKRLSKPSLATDAKSNMEVLGSLFRPDESRIRRKRRLHVPSPSEPLDAAESEMNRGKVWGRAGLPHIALHGLRRFFESLTESLDIPSGVVAQTMAVAPTS